MIVAYKATQPGGFSDHDPSVRYVVGKTVEVTDPDPPSVGPCGRGLHISRSIWGALFWITYPLKAEVYAVEVEEGDVIVDDTSKLRVRRLRVVSRVSYGWGCPYPGDGDGHGDGDGVGDGYGHGDGPGHGDQSGYGFGSGSGAGFGDGYNNIGHGGPTSCEIT